MNTGEKPARKKFVQHGRRFEPNASTVGVLYDEIPDHPDQVVVALYEGTKGSSGWPEKIEIQDGHPRRIVGTTEIFKFG